MTLKMNGQSSVNYHRFISFLFGVRLLNYGWGLGLGFEGFGFGVLGFWVLDEFWGQIVIPD